MSDDKSALAPRKEAQQERSRRRVESILSATQTLLSELPSHQVNTRAIAERAKVSVGTLYQFFPKKEAIYYELFSRWLAATVKALDAVNAQLPDTANYEDCVEAFLRALTDPELNSQQNWKLRLAMSSSKQLAALEEKHRADVFQRVAAIQSRFQKGSVDSFRMPILILQNEYTVASLITLSHLAGTPDEEEMYQMCKKLLLVVYDYERWQKL